MSIVKDAIIQEIQERAKNSINYKRKIDSSKTKFKRDYYSKKLKENNRIVSDLLIALEKLDKKPTGEE